MANFDYGELDSQLNQADNLVAEIHSSLLNGYVDENRFPAVSDLGPKLLTNQEGNQIYNQIKHALLTCESYTFAVAFITDPMLAALKPTLKIIADKGVHGRLITSNYLYFNKPVVFHELLKIPNLEVRIAEVDGFHQKGYIFQHPGYQTIIIGSANLTKNALLKNYEWSMQVNSLDNGYITNQISENIEQEWTNSQQLNQSWIDNYQTVYELNARDNKKAQRQIIKGQPGHIGEKIVPNRMQADALAQIAKLRAAGKGKGLVVSATGTGKTYLGAFDVQKFKPCRMLFLAHREQILKKSKSSFFKVIGGSRGSYGLFTGNRHDDQAKYLFATVQTLSKDKNLRQFSPEEFDYILIDEVHHLGAESYQKIMDYFHPKFYLGMTATPERSDDFSVFKAFDYNVAYEIRLQQALEEGMLCPFHYVGISDYQFADASVNTEIANYNNESKHRNRQKESFVLEHLASEERVQYILEQTEYYGYSGDVLHGLVFCSSVEEAGKLATEFTKQGYPARALSGSDSIQERQKVVQKLETGEIKYIVTVDVFNEGIDIPCVNQVVLLRNTNSSIVYIQQLGRGLRKAQGKEYVEVLDFIGNYKNNYMIPIALTGDDSCSKDDARKTVEIEPVIGLSMISFDEISKERIYQSLRASRLDDMRKLRDMYKDIKARVGRAPLLVDFYMANSVDPVIIANKKNNYAEFLLSEGEKIQLTEYENKVMTFVDRELLNGKRRHELLLLKRLLELRITTGKEVRHILEEDGCNTEAQTLASMQRILDLTFFNKNASPSRSDYGGKALVEWDSENETYSLNEEIWHALQTNEWFKRLWKDAIEAGLLRARKYKTATAFTVGEKYTRKDAMRLGNNEINVTAQNIGGYFFNEQNGFIFVTYNKSNKISESIRYEDTFVNDHTMHYYSKNNRRLTSPDIKKFTDGQRKLLMFVKRSDADDDKTFYYLGSCKYLSGSAKQEELDGKPIVSMDLELKTPVEYTLYHSIIDQQE